MIDPLGSVSALSLARGLGASATGATGLGAAGPTADGGGTAPAADAGFAATLARTASNMEGDLRHAEELSIKGIKGQASTREVVDAVMSAQQSLQTAIAIRDKIVTAYLDISHMQI